uniref:tRNA(Ile)-lysidine synthase, chloroplastic n=1 Tax=Caloglossa monosticha TaxID=76906 RepID=A0A1Z1M4P8_9FLOR|nr:tRNA Ile-lysidine synthetase [Caloglossa monosticha]ARW60986.1 tRNA Ile-lysidine synthetase [Caloglossa monosticha]
MQKYFNYLINKLTNKYKIQSVLIAISGGQDSICLIRLFESFNKVHNLKKIEYIYVDHQWSKNSKKQILHIINYLRFLKKNIHIYQISKIDSSEYISRKCRYHIIVNHAALNKHQAVITAHTKTDKLETFLLNLARGTGLEGATSLNLHQKLNYSLNLFRPLIFTNRINIAFFCKKWFLPLWSDISNYNYNIRRNRIRNEIFPYLKKYLNNKYENHFLKFLKTCYYDNEYIKQKTTKLYIYLKSDHYIAINFHLLKQEPFSIQVRILQLLIYHNLCVILNTKILIKVIKYININMIKKYSVSINSLQYLRLYLNIKWIYITLKI